MCIFCVLPEKQNDNIYLYIYIYLSSRASCVFYFIFDQADVYSFGLILWEMLSLKRPFEGLNRKEFVQSVIKGGRRPPLQQDWSVPLRELLTRCWDEDMDHRPGEKVVLFFFFHMWELA